MKSRCAVLAILFCTFPLQSTLGGEPSLIVDGTSHMSSLTTAWAEAAPQANFRLSVSNKESGSGGGFKRLVAGHSDIHKSARPLLESEQRHCEARQIELIDVLAAHGDLNGESLRLLVNAESLKRESVRDFLKFCLSDVGQELAREHGNPLTAEQLQASRKLVDEAIDEFARSGEAPQP